MVMPYATAPSTYGLGGFGTGPSAMAALTPQQRMQAFASLLSSIGGGLLSGRNLSEGLGAGVQAGSQSLSQGVADRQRQQYMDMQQQEYQQKQAEQQRLLAQQQAQQAATAKLAQSGQYPGLTQDVVTAYPSIGEDLIKNSLVPQKPYSSIGNLDADLKAGRITKPEYDAALRKETYIAPQQPVQPNEIQVRLRLATDAWNAANPDKIGKPTLKFLQDYGVTPTPKQGMTVYGPDGKPIVEMGGNSGMGKQTANTYEESLLNTTNSLNRMTDVQKSFKPEYQTFGTRAGMAWDEFKTRLNPDSLDPTERQGLEDFSKYKLYGYNNLNRGIKELTGVAMNQTEGERLLVGMPDPGTGIFDGDGPVKFKSKMDATIQTAKDAIMRANYAAAHGLNPLSSGIELSDVPALLNKRGDEIAAEVQKTNPAITPDALAQAVNAQLDKEFGR